MAFSAPLCAAGAGVSYVASWANAGAAADSASDSAMAADSGERSAGLVDVEASMGSSQEWRIDGGRPPWGAAAALLACHAFARAAAVGVMVSLPYGGDAEHAKAKPLALAVAPRNFGIALGWCAVLSVVLLCAGLNPARLALAVVAAAGVAWLMRQWLKRRLGGYTGDGLGATEQLAEIAVLMAFTSAL